jgi:hypothetical protein
MHTLQPLGEGLSTHLTRWSDLNGLSIRDYGFRVSGFSILRVIQNAFRSTSNVILGLGMLEQRNPLTAIPDHIYNLAGVGDLFMIVNDDSL